VVGMIWARGRRGWGRSPISCAQYYVSCSPEAFAAPALPCVGCGPPLRTSHGWRGPRNRIPARRTRYRCKRAGVLSLVRSPPRLLRQLVGRRPRKPEVSAGITVSITPTRPSSARPRVLPLLILNSFTQRGTFRMGVAGRGGTPLLISPRTPIFQLLNPSGAPSLVVVLVVRPTSGSLAALAYIRIG